jgi:AraC-like DNA-binding protein
MQIASELLSGGNANVATISAEIGYESEAAFSRAFKKMMGVPPSAWRHRVRSGGSCPNLQPAGSLSAAADAGLRQPAD